MDQKKKLRIGKLEKRLMLDASLAGLAGTQVFAENTINETPQQIDSDVTVTGATNDFDGETLTIAHNGGAQDQLSIRNEGTAAGQISISGNTVSYGGTAIGTMTSDGSNGSDLVVEFNATTSKAALERLIENITYQNTSDAPTALRAATITLTTSSGAATDFTSTVNLAVSPENDKAAMNGGSSFHVADGESYILTASDLDISDPDNADSELTVNITDILYGRLERVSNAGVEITSFTYDELLAGDIRYVNDGGDFITDGYIQFEVFDGNDTTYVSDKYAKANDDLSADYFYMFDDGSGITITEENGNGVNVTRNSASWTSSSGMGDGVALDFPGGTSAGASVDALTIGGEVTFSMLAKFDSTDSWQTLFDFGNGNNSDNIVLKRVSNSSAIRFSVFDGATEASIDVDGGIVNGEWALWTTSVAADGTLSIYKNGVLLVSENVGATANTLARSSNLLGDSNNGSHKSLNGQIAGFSIFDRKLTDAEVGQLAGNIDITLDQTSNEAPVTTVNTGVEVSGGLSISIGAEAGTRFGDVLWELADGYGVNDTVENTVNNNRTQHAVIVTMPEVAPSSLSVPGQVIYENGGAGRGYSLVLNSDMQLEVRYTTAQYAPRMVSPDAFQLGETYAIVLELDNIDLDAALHYEAADNFNWYSVDRTPEIVADNMPNATISGGNNTGVGDQSGNSLGGFSGGSYNLTEFMGIIHDTYNIYQMTETSVLNERLVTTDPDTLPENIIYTITSDVSHGTLTLDGVVLGAGGTFTQADLNNGLVLYNNNLDGSLSDSFSFSVSDGNVTLGADTFDITVSYDNTAPELTAASFNVPENTNNGATVATITGADADVGQTLTYSISGGTGAGVFAIDANTGEVTVLDKSGFDFETGDGSYTLDVTVTDNGIGNFSDTETFTFILRNVDERPTITANGPFTISENLANGTSVGFISATDPDTVTGDTVSYSIVTANAEYHDIFEINSTTGEITVKDNTYLNYENETSYTFTVRATGSGGLARDGNVTVTITDIDEAPSLDRIQAIFNLDAELRYNSDNGNFYFFHNDSNVAGYAAAEADLAGRIINGQSGYIATITSGTENTFVTKYLTRSSYLGGSDTGTENVWLWLGGEEAGIQFSQGASAVNGFYERWASSEPDGNDYMYIQTNGYWYDAGSGSSLGYVGEYNGADVINNTAYSINHSLGDASDVNVGDSLGYVFGADAEGDLLSYSIEGGNDDGIFEIDATSGELRIASTANIDVLDTYTLTIRGTETNGLGQYGETTITIGYNRLPGLQVNSDATVLEGNSVTIADTNLLFTDPDSNAADITYVITSQPSNGEVHIGGVQVNTFTQADIDNGDVTFVHNGSETTSDSFAFSVSDGDSDPVTGTFNLSVTPQNDSVSITTNTGANMNEGGTITITSSRLLTTDADAADTATDITYTITSQTNGAVHLNGSALGVSDTFTQDDINNNRVTYVHDGSETTGANFQFSVADDLEHGAVARNGTFSLNVTLQNEGPVATTNTGTNVTEGGIATIDNSMLAVTDPDTAAANITYSLSDLVGGYVAFSSNTAIPILSFTQAQLNSGIVRFVHDGNEADGSFGFTVADNGADGAVADTGTFTLTKDPVNDAPEITKNLGTTVDQGGITILRTSILNMTDTDDSGDGITWTVTGTNLGQIELLSNPNVAITSFTQTQLEANQIVFRHTGVDTTTASFDLEVADNGENGAGTDTATVSVSVNNTNDQPIIATNTGITMDEGTTHTILTSELDGFDPDDVGIELTWTINNISSHIDVRLSGSSLSNGQTFTQADLDNGLITIVHDGTENFTGGFDVTLQDGGQDGTVPVNASVTVTITPVNESPVLVTNTGTSVNEGAAKTITSAMLSFSDVDDAATGLSYTVSNLSGGVVKVSGSAQISFTQDDIDNNRVTFEHDGGEGASAGFDYALADGLEDDVTAITGTFAITVNAVNDAPDLTNNGLTLNEGASATITTSALTATDPDNTNTELVYTVSVIPANGELRLNGTAMEAGETFTQDELATGRVSYVHAGGENTADSFTFILTDGNVTLGADTFDLIITPVNDAPVGIVNNGGSISEGQSGVTVTQAMLEYTDNDHTPAQITYTVKAVDNGLLRKSGVILGLNNTFTQADINNGLITYSHNSSETTFGGFDFDVSDGTTGATGQTFAFTVTPVNDAPVVGINTGTTVNEGASVTLTTSMLDTSDSDTADASLIYTVTSTPVNGTLYRNGVALAANDTFTQTDLIAGLISYTHDGGETVSDDFDFDVSDGALSVNGNTFDLTITPQNDSAVLATNTGMTMNEGATKVITSAMLSATDIDDADSTLVYTLSNLSNGVIQVSGSDALTFTQDDLDNNRVTFIHDGGETTAAGFDFSIADGLEHGAAVVTGSFAITVTPQNDSPSISVNTGATVGERLGVTITSAMLDSIDPDDNAVGLTYTASNFSNGWIVVGGTIQNSFTQADIDNGRVVFQHDSSETISASFDISIADDGEHGSVTDTGTFTLTVTPRNDEPVVVTNLGATVSEGNHVTITHAMLAATDDASPANALTWTVTGMSHGHLINNISMLAVTSFSQADLNAGVIDFVHNGGESLHAGFSGNIRDNGADGVLPVGFTFNMNVTPVNDAPTEITISKAKIPENVPIGATVGMLHTADMDLPGDTFTYTLLDNPGGMFEIRGNELVMAVSPDFERIRSETIMIRSDDGNGGMFDQMITIDFTDVNERSPNGQFGHLRPDQPDRPHHLDDRFSKRLEDRQNRPDAVSLGRPSFFLEERAFNAENPQGHRIGHLRDVEGRGAVQDGRQGTGISFDNVAVLQERDRIHGLDHSLDLQTNSLQQPNLEPLQDGSVNGQEISTLKDALEFFTRMETIQDYLAEQGEHTHTAEMDGFKTDPTEIQIDENTPLIKRLSIEEQFEDVLTYHLKQQQALKAALLASS
jgi:hypothetical protein